MSATSLNRHYPPQQLRTTPDLFPRQTTERDNLPLSGANWDLSLRGLFLDVQRPIAEASWTSHGQDSHKESRW